MSEKKHTVGIYTLGCRVNQYESNAMASAFEHLGFEVLPFSDSCDAYVINTCTVTAESDRKSKQIIRRAVTRNPDAVIAVSGCFSQVSPESALSVIGVDLVFGNGGKMKLPEAVLALLQNRREGDAKKAALMVNDITNAPFEHMSITHVPRTRADVKIEDGCENRCAYCIIPKARGNIRSKAPEDVFAEVRDIVQNGCSEIVLTGIETAAYGKGKNDTGMFLPELIGNVAKIDGVRRIRTGSLDPSFINPKNAEILAKIPKLMPHYHISVQSGSSGVLARMRRRYNTEMLGKYIDNMRTLISGVTFSADVIVGFPGETDEEFAETLAFFKKYRFLSLHVFTYSKRAGTEAAGMPNQVPEPIKKQRSEALYAAQAAVFADLAAAYINDGALREILTETAEFDREKGLYLITGHTPEFFEVKIESSKKWESGQYFHAMLHTAGDGVLFGTAQ